MILVYFVTAREFRLFWRVYELTDTAILTVVLALSGLYALSFWAYHSVCLSSVTPRRHKGPRNSHEATTRGLRDRVTCSRWET
ncbi:hypothetical protein MrNuV_ORF032 [Macrobrachium rosenbergii nudivirus]|nr:hypothetical protein MrNuV_ORF032 [Macrobrachium rosenbergii nudivirus]